MFLEPTKINDADHVFHAYVGNGARSLELWGLNNGYILRGIIDHAPEPQIFRADIDLARFGLAMLEEIIHDATIFINHKYRKES
jgi:hypothetical protein